MLKIILKVIDILRIDISLLRFFKIRPRSVASLKILMRLQKDVPHLESIIDAGANIGQFARAASIAYSGAKIFSIEPDPNTVKKIKDNLSDLKQVQIYQTAIGIHRGVTNFYRNEYSQASSILPLANNDEGLLSEKRKTEIMQVPITTLDDLFSDKKLKHPILLKMDLQGFEHQALQGAERLLNSIDYILSETVFTRSYEDEALFNEISMYLERRNFYFVRPMAFVENSKGHIVQMDCLFQRSNNVPDEHLNLYSS